MIKKIISLSLSVFLLFTVTKTAVFAKERISNEVNASTVIMSDFVDSLRPFFNNPNLWRVLDAEEQDISDDLYNDCAQQFFAGNYEEIYFSWGNSIKYVDYYVDMLANNEQAIKQSSTYPARTAYVSKSVRHDNFCYICDTINALSFEASVGMIGTYQVNVSEGVISSATNPSVSLVSYTAASAGPCYTGIVTRGATISNDAQSVTFKAKFHIYREIAGVVNDCGKFEGVLIGNPAGTLLSYAPEQYGYPIG